MNNQSYENPENIGQQMGHMADCATEQIRQAASRVTKSVESNPMSSLLWAGMVGFMLGIMARR